MLIASNIEAFSLHSITLSVSTVIAGHNAVIHQPKRVYCAPQTRMITNYGMFKFLVFLIKRYLFVRFGCLILFAHQYFLAAAFRKKCFLKATVLEKAHLLFIGSTFSVLLLIRLPVNLFDFGNKSLMALIYCSDSSSETLIA